MVKNKKTSPKSGLELSNKNLTPNIVMKNMVTTILEMYPNLKKEQYEFTFSEEELNELKTVEKQIEYLGRCKNLNEPVNGKYPIHIIAGKHFGGSIQKAIQMGASIDLIDDSSGKTVYDLIKENKLIHTSAKQEISENANKMFDVEFEENGAVVITYKIKLDSGKRMLLTK